MIFNKRIVLAVISAAAITSASHTGNLRGGGRRVQEENGPAVPSSSPSWSPSSLPSNLPSVPPTILSSSPSGADPSALLSREIGRAHV